MFTDESYKNVINDNIKRILCKNNFINNKIKIFTN